RNVRRRVLHLVLRRRTTEGPEVQLLDLVDVRTLHIAGELFRYTGAHFSVDVRRVEQVQALRERRVDAALALAGAGAAGLAEHRQEVGLHAAVVGDLDRAGSGRQAREGRDAPVHLIDGVQQDLGREPPRIVARVALAVRRVLAVRQRGELVGRRAADRADQVLD